MTRPGVIVVSMLFLSQLPVAGVTAAETQVSIPMSDGVELAGEVLTPDTGKSFPVLLNMTPYGPATYFDTYRGQGYAHVNVDIRGTGASGGKLCLFCVREQRDVYEVVEWIAKQEWSDGNVGMYGGSYQGITPLMGAAHQPPHLKAIVPQVVLADAYRDIVWHNGLFNLNFVAQWTALQFGLGQTGIGPTSDAASRPEQRLAAESRLIPWDGAFYKERSIYTKFDRIKVPTLLLGGWFDGFSRGTVRDYQGIASEHKRLVMMPCTHKGCGGPFDPGSEYPDGMTIPGLEDPVLAWMDHFLKGVDNGVEAGAPVLYYDIGSHEWVGAASWPPRDTRLQTFYLSGDPSGSASSLNDGSLVANIPDSDAVEDRFVYNPFVGVTEAMSKWGTVAATPHARTDNRPDEAQSLTYTTPPMDKPMVLAGPMELNFWAITSASDTDWIVKVTDVADDGSSRLLTTGSVRASHRKWSKKLSKPGVPWLPNSSPAAVPAGKPLEYRVDIWDIAHTVLEGHRLRITISSADFPNHEPLFEPAVNILLHAKAYPSKLLVTTR
ncbi:MAG TPA: CocE/NonD family hydrolase [Actinomycetota bacterium]|nr:CocE/NonD family hydrolase [Actinomycetota bacterium]